MASLLLNLRHVLCRNLFLSSSCWVLLQQCHQHDISWIVIAYFTNQYSLNSIVSYEKNEQVQQADLFKRQTLMFSSQNIFRIHPMYYDYYQACKCLTKNDTGTDCMARSFLHQSLRVLLVCKKTLVSIRWMQLCVNGISAKSFCPQEGSCQKLQQNCQNLSMLPVCI